MCSVSPRRPLLTGPVRSLDFHLEFRADRKVCHPEAARTPPTRQRFCLMVHGRSSQTMFTTDNGTWSAGLLLDYNGHQNVPREGL